MTIHCYAFAPPPVVSLNLSRRYKNLIDSFVVEDDIICRMSYGHMMDLKSMIIAAVHREKKPSWLSNIQATVSTCCCFLCSVSTRKVPGLVRPLTYFSY